MQVSLYEILQVVYNIFLHALQTIHVYKASVHDSIILVLFF